METILWIFRSILIFQLSKESSSRSSLPPNRIEVVLVQCSRIILVNGSIYFLISLRKRIKKRQANFITQKMFRRRLACRLHLWEILLYEEYIIFMKISKWNPIEFWRRQFLLAECIKRWSSVSLSHKLKFILIKCSLYSEKWLASWLQMMKSI